MGSDNVLRSYTMKRPRFINLILLTVGTFLGYQLAFLHLQPETGPGQVILSKKQFEHMLRNMNSETWNQPGADEYAQKAAQDARAPEDISEGSESESLEEDFKRPIRVPPDLDLYRNSSCRRTNASRWFQERFDKTIKPEWSKENIILPGEIFRWWNSIQPGNESLKEVLTIAQALRTTPALVGTSINNSCIKCAVVGNSASIAHSGYGKFIDNHRRIFRMNRCPTGKYVADVGDRTTHYFAYPESFYEEYLKDTLLVFIPFKADDLQWLGDHVRSLPGNKIDKFHLYNPHLMWQIKHNWGIESGHYPSTGIMAVFYALYTCHEVDVFGFGPDSRGRWDHYYDKDFREEISLFKRPVVHNAQAELDLLYKLDSVGKIRIFRGAR